MVASGGVDFWKMLLLQAQRVGQSRHLSSLFLQLVDDEQGGIQEAFDAVAQASLLAPAEAGADGRLDALVPASVCERVDRRLHASLGLLGVEERLQLFLISVGEPM